MLPIERIKQQRAMRVDVQFHHECYMGDELTINYEQLEDIALFEIVQNGTVSALKCSIEWL